MMSKKIPLHFSDEFLREVDELAGLLGMNPQVYGYVPKTLRFSITFALATLKMQEKVIPGLKEGELDLWFSSVKKLRQKRELTETAQKAQEAVSKV